MADTEGSIPRPLPPDDWTYDGLALGVRVALDQLVVGLSRAARAFVHRKGWTHFGHARSDDHARETLGRSGRWLRDLAALGVALESLPTIEAALTGRDGQPPLGQVAAVAIARVASDESIDAWLELARRVPVRTLKDHVRAARETGSSWPVNAGSARPTDAGSARPIDADSDDPVGPHPRIHSSNPGVDLRPGHCEPAQMDAGMAAKACDSKHGNGTSRDEQPNSGHGEDTEDAVVQDSNRGSGTEHGIDHDSNGGKDDGDCIEPNSNGDVTSKVRPSTDNVSRDDDICTATLQTPLAARVLFDDTRLLHSAVCGRDEPAVSLIEALIAEANAGPVPVDADIREQPRFSPADHRRQVETEAYFNTDNWQHLQRPLTPCERAALDTLDEADDVMAKAGTGGPAELQQQIRTLVHLEERLQRQLGQLLLNLGHARAWSALDFTGLGHYAEQRLGMSRTATRNRVTVARGLLERPLLRQAYEDGRLGLEAAVLILRVLRRGNGSAGDAVEQEWVEHASRTTLKRLRDETRVLCGARSLDAERDPSRPVGTREWHASLRMAPGDFRGRLRDLAAQATDEHRYTALRLQLPRQLADDYFAAIESRRQLLAAAIARENAAGSRSVQPAAQSFSSNGPCDQQGSQLFSSNTHVAPVPWKEDSVALQTARKLAQRGGRLPLWVGLLALLEDYIETWDDPQAVPRRASQAVYIRDGWRCTAPGCTSRRHLESHHLVYRSQGGAVKDETNQACLCRFHHHQGEHGELASCQGRAPFGVVWRLGHPSVGTWFQNEMRL